MEMIQFVGAGSTAGKSVWNAHVSAVYGGGLLHSVGDVCHHHYGGFRRCLRRRKQTIERIRNGRLHDRSLQALDWLVRTS